MLSNQDYEKRMLIYNMLKNGKTYREISKELNCSFNVISSVKSEHKEEFDIGENSRIDSVKREQVLSLLKNGDSYRNIRRATGCGSKMITSVKHLYQDELNAARVENKNFGIDVGKVCALYKAQWNLSSIASEVQSDSGNVIRILKEEGLYANI